MNICTNGPGQFLRDLERRSKNTTPAMNRNSTITRDRQLLQRTHVHTRCASKLLPC